MQLFSSAYNVWPADEAERAIFIEGLIERDWLGGLELGYFDTVAWPEGVPADLPAIITGVPGTTGHNAKDPDFGLASPDAAGRERALEWARGAARDDDLRGGHGQASSTRSRCSKNSAPSSRTPAGVW